MRLIDANYVDASLEFYAAAHSPVEGKKEKIIYDTLQSCRIILGNAPTIEAAPVVRGEWDYIIEKGSCMDYHVTAKCSECGWDWFSKEGVGNYSAVFSAFITNGDSKPEEAERFLLENARANNKLNYCPNCGAKMEDKP